MRVYDMNEPRKTLSYNIKTRIVETLEGHEGSWFVWVEYFTDEELVVRRVVYGPCDTLIMAVLCEDELRDAHVKSIAALLEHIHTAFITF